MPERGRVYTRAFASSTISRVADFRSDQTLSINAGGAAYRVRLNRIIRKGADWIKARFEIEKKS